MLIRRQLDILMQLINSTEPIKGKMLATIFHVDVRTIRSDIRKINEFLNAYHIHIHSTNRFGYQIQKEDKKNFHQKQILQIIKSDDSFEVPQTPNERISYLFFLLSDGHSYHIEELADLLYISIASIYNDLHIIRRFLEKRFKGLTLRNENGSLRLEGKEAAKRNLLSGIVSQRYHHLLEQKYSEYINQTGSFLDTMYRIIEHTTLHKHQFPFQLTGESLYAFASDISLCLERERQGLFLTYDGYLDTQFAQFTSFLCEHIEELSLLNTENWCYLQDRFYAKNFMKGYPKEYDASLYTFIEEIRFAIKERFQMEILMDDKSCEYICSFLEFYEKNEQKSYYWNEDDKYDIMLHYPMCYMLSLYISYMLFKKIGHHFNTTYLAKCTLVLAESCLRNERKKQGVLICNKDKEHILCLLHKLVKHFGNAIDILEYGTLYDVSYGLIDINSYDILISTEALQNQDQKDYIKISPVCTASDITKISEYLEQIDIQQAQARYEIEVLHYTNVSNILKEYIDSFINLCEDIEIVDQDIWGSWDIEDAFLVHMEHTDVMMITPFLEAKKTKLYHLVPDTPLIFKKHEITGVKLFVINRLDITKLDRMFSE